MRLSRSCSSSLLRELRLVAGLVGVGRVGRGLTGAVDVAVGTGFVGIVGEGIVFVGEVGPLRRRKPIRLPPTTAMPRDPNTTGHSQRRRRPWAGRVSALGMAVRFGGAPGLESSS